ncbi:MAG: PepSY-like domain-containing protein [Bacteroidales bacterium]
MKKLMVLIFASILGCSMLNANETPITQKQLPVIAQNYVKKHFSGIKYLSLLKDNEDGEFEVSLANGTKIEFNKNGEWKSVENRNLSGVPTSVLMPSKLLVYLKTNYPKDKVFKFEKDSGLFSFEYKVKLSNGLELEFDKEGSFLRIDD